MAQFPALPLWTDAYLGDTTHLTTIEHGAYLLLLMAAWRSKECCLPNDDKMLARYSRLTPSQWKRIKPVIMGFFDVEDSIIIQQRLRDEISFVKQKSKSASKNARARWLKNKETTHANASDPQSERNATTPTPTPNIDTNVSIPKKKTPRKHQIPKDWSPNEKAYSIGAAEGYSLQEVNIITQKFTDSAKAKGTVYVEWNKAFYNWLKSGITKSDIDQCRRSRKNNDSPGNGRNHPNIFEALDAAVERRMGPGKQSGFDESYAANAERLETGGDFGTGTIIDHDEP